MGKISFIITCKIESRFIKHSYIQQVGYDDEAIARKKGEYVVANGLGGVMFWSIDNDDFRGSCNGKPYPIIEAAKEAMLQQIG